jgi:hypothetical protein
MKKKLTALTAALFAASMIGSAAVTTASAQAKMKPTSTTASDPLVTGVKTPAKKKVAIKKSTKKVVAKKTATAKKMVKKATTKKAA